jgi:tetratricopeptide (TPR) repeat protein
VAPAAIAATPAAPAAAPLASPRRFWGLQALSWKWRLGITAAFVAAIVGGAATLVGLFRDTDQAWAQCNAAGVVAVDDRIRACGEVITSGKETGRALAVALAHRARAYVEIGETVLALRDFDAAVAANPGDASLFADRGEARLRNGRPQEAIEDFTAALALDAGLVPAMTGRGNALLAMRNPEAALADFTAAMQADPKRADPVYRRAIANARLGRIADAMADYDKTVELDARNAVYWNARCWYRATNGIDMDLALKDCDQALVLRPDFVAALDSRAFVLLRLNRLEEALAAYDAAIVKEPNHAWPYFGRGIVKKRLGDGAGAEADIAEAQRIQPGIDKEYLKFGEAP